VLGDWTAQDDAAVRLAHRALCSDEMRTLNLSNSIARSFTRPFFTAPSLDSANPSAASWPTRCTYPWAGGR